MTAFAVVALFPWILSAQGPESARTTAAHPSSTPSASEAILATEGYVAPPDPIARLVNAPRQSNYTYSTVTPGARRYLVHLISDGLPTLDELGRPHYNLGGFQVDNVANRSRALNTSSDVGLQLYDWSTGKTTSVDIPAGARISRSLVWSPDGNTVAFLAEFPTSNQIVLADPVTGKSRQLTTTGLLATQVTNFEWTADGKSIVAVLLPDARGAEPRDAPIATEPLVRLNEGRKLHTEVFPSLLESPREKALLEYYSTGQLALIDVKTRAIHRIGAPGMIRSLDASPDGTWFRVTYLDKPFSYILPVSNFGTTDEIIDGSGKVLAQISNRPLRENPDTTTPVARSGAAPGGGRGGFNAAADTGKRNLAWHPVDNALIYFQVAPGAAGQRNDSAAVSGREDRVIEWSAPFDSSAASRKELYRTAGRITGAQFSDNGRIIFVSQTGGGASEVAVYLDEGNKAYTVIAATGRNGGRGGRGAGAGGAGGRGGRGATSVLVSRAGSHGTPVAMLSSDGQHVFITGGGNAPAPADGADSTASGSAGRAWVDRIAIRTGERQRIYESTSDIPETIAAPLDDDFGKALITRESATVVPQSFILDLKTRDAKQITSNRDLMPEITNAIRKTVIGRRADGHTFKIMVTLPADWRPGTRLPALFWFYPREYESQEAYDRPAGGAGGGATNRFPSYGPRTMAFITTEGYALIEPDTPIFSQNGQPPNDHYVDDLRDDLAATIDALDTIGIIDRNRLAIGGHSYGAFSTANAMVHTPYFKAGIAGDGDYNRTLTPTGFQNERRDLWQGRETYLDMSPFLYADHLNGALLMYHSEEDQNVGTAPINSIRMFQALQSLGKTAALYMYPYEDHGPIARETDLDQWARWVAWLDKYVKNAGRTAAASEPSATSKQ
ncbi:MAG TPA: prolyl oligopeptidase family serine peptidase [Gemmatimonadales bacterium]